jgi:hypothetical protein
MNLKLGLLFLVLLIGDVSAIEAQRGGRGGRGGRHRGGHLRPTKSPSWVKPTRSGELVCVDGSKPECPTSTKLPTKAPTNVPIEAPTKLTTKPPTNVPTEAPTQAVPSPSTVRRLIEEVAAKRHGRGTRGRGKSDKSGRTRVHCKKAERRCEDGSVPVSPTAPPTAPPSAD